MGARVYLRPPDDDDAEEFLSRARASRALHGPRVSPPGDEAAFTAYGGRNNGGDFRGFLACRREDDATVGVVNFSQVFRGSSNDACLGFYGFSPFVRKGYMTEAVGLALRHAFRSMGLHRVEANLQRSRRRHHRFGLRNLRRMARRSVSACRPPGSPKEGIALKLVDRAERWIGALGGRRISLLGRGRGRARRRVLAGGRL